MNKALEFFSEFSKNTLHGNDTYYDHCMGIYKILKELNCSTDVCLAGLYHSVYGTEYFDIPKKLHTEIVVDLIGEEANRLVHIFCGLKNRFDVILTNSFNFDDATHFNLMCIEYANLKEQSRRNSNMELLQMCDALSSTLFSKLNAPYQEYKIDSMELYVFDTLLESKDINFISNFCLNSLYKPEHKSDADTTALDSRFSCQMTTDDLVNSGLISSIEHIATALNTTIHVGHQYINHYSLMTNVAKHVDSSFSDCMTILVFPNKYWNSEWGGEIAFYSEKTEQHTLVEYKPGRIILFDSRIAHKVLPMNQLAKKDRYSIAIKCSTELGLENFKKVHSNILTIRGNNV